MRSAAIICECNPFHIGHHYIFAEAKKETDCLIAVMSGNFVQRAEAAVFDKYARAEILVRSGADLVVELPFPWCSSSAEYFASAGVHIASSLKADELVFGATVSERLLARMAQELLSEKAQACLYGDFDNNDVKEGSAIQRQRYLEGVLGISLKGILDSPNDILAVEYCKAIQKYDKSMKIRPIPRISQQDNPNFRGATEIRKEIETGSFEQALQFLPADSREVIKREYQNGRYASCSQLKKLIFMHLRTRSFEEINTAEGTDGVLERLIRCAAEADGPDKMYELASTKKYTNARFRRAALYSLMQVKTATVRELPRYSVLLAANSVGRKYLADIRKSRDIALVTKPADDLALSEAAKAQYGKQKEADRIYTLCLNEIPCADIYMKKSPFIL